MTLHDQAVRVVPSASGLPHTETSHSPDDRSQFPQQWEGLEGRGEDQQLTIQSSEGQRQSSPNANNHLWSFPEAGRIHTMF